MHYTLTKVEESDFNEIYNIKKTSVQMYVEKAWVYGYLGYSDSKWVKVLQYSH